LRFFLDPFTSPDGKPHALIIALFAAINGIVVFNCLQHEYTIGYDADDHLAYARALSEGRLPTPKDSMEFFSPPLPYAPAALLRAAGLADEEALKKGKEIQAIYSIVLTFFLLRNGPSVAENLSAAVGRIAGERGNHLLDLAGNTVRGVVYGILGTALVQAMMAGIGFFIAGVPGASLLALMTFFLSVVPVGPPLVWLPAAIWLFNQGSTGWGIFMLIWGVCVSTVDNFVKPWLISQGSNMPFMLILFGVLGGAMAFGFIGVFLGPTLLAVGYRLVQEWSAAGKAVSRNAASDSAPTSAD